MDKILRDALTKGVKALERSAQANEDLLKIAESEQLVGIEPGPPLCPHCGTINPVVTEVGDKSSGPLGDCVLIAETHCCNKPLIAVPIGWETFGRSDEAMSYMRERAGR